MRFCIKSVHARDLSLPALENVKPELGELFFVGDVCLLQREIVAIVGTRAASSYGLGAAFKFGKNISERDRIVVSGLARGIDGAAHRGAVAAEKPTIAVLAHGLDRIYPPEHFALAQKIVRCGGLLLSEYGEGVPPKRRHFPLRNRIIAGLCSSAIVIEAREKSGSLITAQFALDLGRQVYVVPGKYDDPGFTGGHALIQEGAQLLRTVEEVIHSPLSSESDVGRMHRFFLENGGTVTLEELFIRSRFSLADLRNHLDALLRNGKIVEIFPQQYSWITA